MASDAGADPSRRHVTKSAMKEAHARLGIDEGMALAVHCSLGAIGRVEGGPDAVIECLIKMVGKRGALVKPSCSVSLPVPLTPDDIECGLAWKVRVLPYDAQHVRSGMGAVADRFRDRNDVVRNAHPVLSIAAWGEHAAVLAEGYHRLLELDGWVLLLGVDMDRCFALHLAERWVDLPLELAQQMESPEGAERSYPPDQWSVGYRVPTPNFIRVREAADERGLIRMTTVGSATARLFKTTEMVELYARLRMEDPYRITDLPND